MDPVHSRNSKVQKLEQVLKKGESFISLLSEKGVDTGTIKEKMDEARSEFRSNNMGRAYSLAQECIGELITLKAKDETEVKVKPKKGKGVYALIRDSKAEMDKRIKELKEKMGSWRTQGYELEDDDRFFSRPQDDVEKRFGSLEEKIKLAEETRRRVKDLLSEFSVVGKSYKKKLEEIEVSARKLDRVEDLDRRLNGLEATLKSIEGKYRVLNNRLSRYRRKGLSTTFLEEMMDNDEDLDYLEKQFNIYEANMEYLVKEKQKLRDFKEDPVISSLSDIVENIERILDDPWRLDDIVEMMLRLEKEIAKSKERMKQKQDEVSRREEIRESLEGYRSEGFKVEVVEQLLNEDMNLLEEEYDNFIRQMAKLKSLRERLFKLDASGFEEEISRISEKLNDPGNISLIEKDMNGLKDKIIGYRSQSQKINSAIRKWSGKGFIVSKLEEVLLSDISTAIPIFEEYKTRIERLMEIEGKLDKINFRELEDQVHKISLKIKNPDMFDSVNRDFAVVERKIKELERVKVKRKELNDLMKVWRGQGYKIDNILQAMRTEDTFEGLERILIDYTKAIATLESLKGEFEAEERGWFPKEEGFIRDNMDNPDRAMDVAGRFRNLKANNTKEEKKRGQISRKLGEMAKRGLDTSEIEGLLQSDHDTLMARYNEFLPGVTALLRLKAELLREGQTKKNIRLEEFARSMNDPLKIEEYKKEVQEKISPPPGPVVRPVPGKKEKGSEGDITINSLKEMAKKAFTDDKLLEALGLFEAVLSIDSNDKMAQFYRKKALLKMKHRKMSPSDAGKSVPPATAEVSAPPEPVREVEPRIEEPEEEPLEAEELTPEEPAEEVSVEEGTSVGCVSCEGTGKCSWCKGEGKCTTCNGSGKYFEDECPTCKGGGKCSVCEGTGKCTWCSL